MQNINKNDSHTFFAGRKTLIISFIAGILILLSLIPVVMIRASRANQEPPVVVIRVDDIQDFAFKQAQLFLFDESMTNGVPLSLAVIAGMFGEDREIVQAAKSAVSTGSEITVHGWRHEDLTKLSLEEQATLLSQSRKRIWELLSIDTDVLVPPMYSANDDTIEAMREEGYQIISTSVNISKPASFSGVINLPATVELSDYVNGIWKMKSCGSVSVEILKSIEKYGFAVIITHPQEFITGGELDKVNVESFRTLLGILKNKYSVKTLISLSELWSSRLISAANHV
jgi:predicted deacetylase